VCEWDDVKNASNVAKHGISFEMAQRIFDGPVLTAADHRKDYDERGEISIAMVDGAAILTIVHTDRLGRVRIISARPASQRERSRYEQAIR
jgi:uncharacterized protein